MPTGAAAGPDVATLESWYASGRSLEALGRRLFVREGGGGTPLLLIHGFPTSSWDWEAVWPELAHDHRLIAPDLLGFGRSDKPPGHRYSIGEQTDLCVEVLRQLGFDECHVLAHDYGNTVGQELLARANEGRLATRLHSMVFLNGGLFPECHRPVLLQRLLLGPLGPLLARLTSRRRFAANLVRVFGPQTPPSAEQVDGFWHLLNENHGIAALPRLLRYIPERHARRERWVGALMQARLPVGFINGNLDPISGAHMAARWRELLPAAALVELADIGHYPQLEAPQRVLEAYRALRARFSTGGA
ncbi:alpha/beta fold hydrolase [Pseudomarimonas salicorniae]|uniref:Alpha/beta hydrolase n=1 Tax=Pseudomarimonas salicorniae TaxID=2933270 RepID=A0ABT0GKH9_9GAMM|nr:alpha/beta hydrolase [Lysobacter sp. CAU 1642]MCK7594719.1 alpha/beta hydrolase [Lysobacter sp. CAU 1642]